MDAKATTILYYIHIHDYATTLRTIDQCYIKSVYGREDDDGDGKTIIQNNGHLNVT